MALPKADVSKTAGQAARLNSPDVTNDAGTGNADVSPGAIAGQRDVADKRPIRTVGPQFLPVR